MRVKSKADLKTALAKVMRIAKNVGDFSESEITCKNMEEIKAIINEALEEPSIAELDMLDPPQRYRSKS